MIVKELEIKAPWGKIALKLWGDETDKPIISVHGVMDNAGTFDRLIPRLPQSYFYICIDLPGHGKSSHFPPHLPIYSVNYIIVYKLVMDYFNYEKYIIMGHSYGGQLGFLFAQMYPERIEKLIMYETIHLFPASTNMFDLLAERFEQHFNTEEKLRTNNAPLYRYQEALDKIIYTRASITNGAAEALLQRMLVPKGDGKYEMSMDQRLKYFINPIHDIKYILGAIKGHPVQCPVLMILGKDSKVQRYVLKPILNLLKMQKNVVIKYVPGGHDVHNTHPELVAPIVQKFLSIQKSKL